MEVVLHIPNQEYAAKLMAEAQFYILRNKIDEYAKENNLSDNEKKFIYEMLIKEIKKD